MVPYMLLLSLTLLSLSFAYEPMCSSCKFFIPHNKGNYDLGFCKAFKNISYKKGKEVIIYDFAMHCRNNEDMCGKAGLLYEPVPETDDILDTYNELMNRCCGEVNETDEIEQLEREFFEVFQKIKSHNKKKIYKTTKDLYKLFKNKQ